VYGDRPFPPARTISADSPIISLAEYALSTKQLGTLPIMDGDGAVGDPASMGIAVLMANQTLKNATYAKAAAEQLDYLLNVAPRAPNGAISHRASQVQLWDDFIYMAPPFIAYYGALTNNASLLLQAKQQYGSYRDIMRDAKADNLWHHILLGSPSDSSLWGTGMAWAAAGGTRVLQTMAKSKCARSLIGDMWGLAGWITEMMTGVWKHQDHTGGIRNRVNNATDFLDSSSTALFAAATYRLAVLTGDCDMVSNAEKAFDYIATKIASDGTLQQTVDPFHWDILGTQSPEGQAFVLLLQAAYRDYECWKKSRAPPTLLTVW